MPDTVLLSAFPPMTGEPILSSSLWLFSVLTPVNPCCCCTGEPSTGPSTPGVSHFTSEVEGKDTAQGVNIFSFPEETVILNC